MAHQPAIAERVFGVKYRLQRSSFRFCHAQVRDLPANRCGVYTLWLPAVVEDEGLTPASCNAYPLDLFFFLYNLSEF